MSRRSAAILALLLLSPIALIGCGGRSGERSDRKKSDREFELEPELVRVRSPEIGSLSARLEITARVVALENADVLPRAEGVIVEVLVDEGEDVEKGRLLARIESDRQRIAVQKAQLVLEQARLAKGVSRLAKREAEAALEGAELKLERRKGDRDRVLAQHAKRAVSDQDLDAAEYDYTQAVSEFQQSKLKLDQAEEEIAKQALSVKDAEVKLAESELELSYTELRAPISGRVTRRHLRLGQKAVMGQPAYSIADLDSLVAEPRIPEKDLRILDEDLPVRVRSTSYPGRDYLGRVAYIAPEIDADGGAIRVRVALEPGDPPLRPGMFVSGHIETERRDGVLLLPKKALLFDRERPYVFVIDEEAAGEKLRVKKVYLRRGLQDADSVEYLPPEGEDAVIDAESRIVVVGLDKLADGAEVELEGSAEERVALPVKNAKTPAPSEDS